MSYNSCGAPVLDNYAQARAHYERVKPIRKKDVRPLGNRRWYHQSSISMDGDNVVLNYCNGPAVIWHPDDSITVMRPRYASASRLSALWPACMPRFTGTRKRS